MTDTAGGVSAGPGPVAAVPGAVSAVPGAVSAVIVNYNAGRALLECVRSLRAEGVTEITVVDNDSSDGSNEALLATDPDVRLIRSVANRGYGTAANRGVATASTPYVLVLNPDVVVEPGAIKALAATLDRDPRIGVVGPRTEEPDGSLYPSARRFPDLAVAAGHAFLGYVAPNNRFSRAYKLLDWDHSRPGDVDWLSGSCMLIRGEAYRQVRGFDERYFMYVEDVDLCWQLWQSGWRVAYEPAATVIHIGGVSTDQVPYRMILEHHRSLWRFASKTARGRRRLALPLVAVGLILRTALSWGQRALETWRGRLAVAAE